jgi:organic radical activating enzyme
VTAAKAAAYFKEITRPQLGTPEVGCTSGEPFMIPRFLPLLAVALSRGFEALVRTNAVQLLQRAKAKASELVKATAGFDWLNANGSRLALAGRSCWQEAKARPDRLRAPHGRARLAHRCDKSLQARAAAGDATPS